MKDTISLTHILNVLVYVIGTFVVKRSEYYTEYRFLIFLTVPKTGKSRYFIDLRISKTSFSQINEFSDMT